MMKNLQKLLKRYYLNVINSIALYPALIAVSFLLLSYLLLMFDFSETGRQLKSDLSFVSLKDASTARSIAATVAGGILSLTVFSFSMVMILLNQAASNMSNRVLDSMIGNRFQQWVLGFYIGTIVYALFLLSTIRDIDSGIYVPALSVYLLILLTIIDIFLFIYFLHYITQSVKYETIIERIYTQTMVEMKKACLLKVAPQLPPQLQTCVTEFNVEESGYFQGFEEEPLVELCAEHNWVIRFYHPTGTFLIEGIPLLAIHTASDVTKEQLKQLNILLSFYRGEPVNINYYYGFKQLMEVAIKALSPGINDPGTAILSLHALVDLLSYRMLHYPAVTVADKYGTQRIILQQEPFEVIFEKTMLPIWDYGKEDRLLKAAMQHLLGQMAQRADTLESKTVIASLNRKVQT
jgi:uncharacterized membrane protein